MKVTVENEKIKVNSPYNKSFVAGAKQIQGKWNAPCWVFPEENKEAVRAFALAAFFHSLYNPCRADIMVILLWLSLLFSAVFVGC